MKKTFPVYGAIFLALIGTGFVINGRTAVAQQGDKGMEEVVVVEAPLEGREVGRSNIGAKIEEFELRRPVSYADLDLCENVDVTTMESRIEDTAKALCKELSDKFPLNPADNTERARCAKKAVDGTREQLQAAITTAKSDTDGDGVINCKDRCPATPPNAQVDASGCTPALTTERQTIELPGVNFEFDSSVLTADSSAALDKAVQLLTQNADLIVEIAGHTDSLGSDEYNQGLSERRAAAVLDYLVAHGVNPGNLTARGYGESEPIADNGTQEGRAANRRVELRQN